MACMPPVADRTRSYSGRVGSELQVSVKVEIVFRTMKKISLHIRPIHHRNKNQEWHMRFYTCWLLCGISPAPGVSTDVVC